MDGVCVAIACCIFRGELFESIGTCAPTRVSFRTTVCICANYLHTCMCVCACVCLHASTCVGVSEQLCVCARV